MDTTPVPAIGRFRPTSWPDFKTYAGHLAWLLKLDRLPALELLARIYGYANTHEIQAALKQPGRVGFIPPRPPAVLDPHPPERALLLTAKALGFETSEGITLAGLPARAMLVRDLELFAPPGEHRAAFTRLKRRLLITSELDLPPATTIPGAAASDSPQPPSDAASDYGQLVETDSGMVDLQMTRLGLSVLDAANDLKSHFPATPQELGHFQERFLLLFQRYPRNPWLHATYVSTLFYPFYQANWSENLERSPNPGGGYSQLDANPDHHRLAAQHAARLLEHVNIAVSLFDELLDGRADRLLDVDDQLAGADALHVSDTLAMGACIAANAGHHRLAIRLGQRYLKANRTDRFGIRYLLSPLYLNEGRPTKSIGKLYGPNREPIRCLCEAASAASRGDREHCVMSIVQLLHQVWSPIDVLGGTWHEARLRLRVFSNHHTPAFLQETRFRSSSFWEHESHVERFFHAIARDTEVRRIVFDHHLAKTDTFGLALLAPAHARENTRKLSAASDAVFSTLPERLRKLWAEHFPSVQ